MVCWRRLAGRRRIVATIRGAQLDVFLGRRREAVISTRVIAYCRVSSNAQKPDLLNQKRTFESFCAARGLADVEWIDEVGGGLNFSRKKFARSWTPSSDARSRRS
jgi:predicted site-specific integrase-resolvase